MTRGHRIDQRRNGFVAIAAFLHISLSFLSGCSCHTGGIRLVDGFSAGSGRVEVYLNGRWGTVCDDSWGEEDARVACRELGFDLGATSVSSAGFGSGSGPIWLDNVGCSGNEASITSCSHAGTGVHNCGHSEDAGVICSDIRLVGGSSQNEGRVEVYHDNQWGTVCDDSWSHEDAEVVCRQLGLNDGATAYSSAHFGEGNGPIWLDDVGCGGNEVTLSSCSNLGWGVHNCAHSEDAGVLCTMPVIRLGGSLELREGRVEVYHQDRWGTVCDDDWDDTDASVVCRQLGYSTRGKAVHQSAFGQRPTTYSRMWLDNVDCRGNENYLSDCGHSGWGVSDCTSIEEAGVICKDDTSSCSLEPCFNGGRCIGQPSGYVCLCLDGFQGEKCEHVVSSCLSEPCLNGSSCVEAQDGYICVCVNGFHGDNCEIESSTCAAELCQNRGTCIAQNGGFVCVCRGDFTGEHCQKKRSSCSTNPCNNGGSCVEQLYGYICTCPNGFRGHNCDLEYPTCATDPCGNGGTCVTQEGGYVCVCRSEFTGKNCQNSTDGHVTTNVTKSAQLNMRDPKLMLFVIISTALCGLSLCFVISMVIFVVCMQKKTRSDSGNLDRTVPPMEMGARYSESPSHAKDEEDSDIYELEPIYDN